LFIVADNIQITNKLLEKAVRKEDPYPIQQLVKKCESAGAEAIDINSGPVSQNPGKMAFLVQVIQDVTDLPVLLDSANPKAIEAGLKASNKTAIINGVSLEPVKLESILPLAKEYGTDIIGYLLNPDSSVPPDMTGRLNVAVELFKKCLDAGIDTEKLIIDPIVAPVIWQDGNIQDMEVLNVIRQLPDLLGFPVRTIAGLSNLTTGKGIKEKKLLLERTYLPMLAASGLNYILMNVFHLESVKTAVACRELMSNGIFTWESV